MHNDHDLPSIPAALSPSLFAGPSWLAAADALPQMPTMASTRLRMELLLQDSSVDLKAMSEVILSDAGATLQILRLIGEEYPDEKDRPTRIEDCIVSLNRDRWYGVVCASGLLHGGPLMTEWQHCRRVAEYARELAHLIDGISPEQAYLVGLLYQLGRFPDLLGWNRAEKISEVPVVADSSGEHWALSMMLADYWHLPKYLLSAIHEMQEPVPSSRWSDLLQVAHRLADHAQVSGTAEPV